MIARTKIVATIGPASQDVAVLSKLLQAGANVFRVNFSHGTYEEHAKSLANIAAASQAVGKPVAVLADLCGPKIRVGKVVAGGVELREGAEIVIQRETVEGDASRISTTLPEMIDNVHPGECIMIDDGKMRLEVTTVNAPVSFTCRVTRGGKLSSGKGINLPHTNLALSALTEKDRRDVAWIAARPDIDYVALSFVQNPADIHELRALLQQHGKTLPIVAKIEKPQALACIEEIVQTVDAVMVARGDLGVEMELPSVPLAQKRIVRLCQRAGKPCIVATQMLESMIDAATPTRAEVCDIANAVIDQTDAVMLSGETAIGKYPVEAVTMMHETIAATETWHDDHDAAVPDGNGSTGAIVAAVRAITRQEKVAAVAVYTASGATARVLSKSRLHTPILAVSPDASMVRRVCLYYGVAPVCHNAPEHTRDVLTIAQRVALANGLAKSGDKLLVVSGRPIGKPGTTNTIVLHTVTK